MTERRNYLIEWFMERLDDPPIRLHVRGVWADDDDGLGSVLGAPDWNQQFAAWLGAAPRSTMVYAEPEPCPHRSLSDTDRVTGVLCPDCATTDSKGNPIARSDGTRFAQRHVYRHPMKAALALLDQRCAPPAGMPNPSYALAVLAACDGSARDAADFLSGPYPRFSDRDFVGSYFGFLIRQLKGPETPDPNQPPLYYTDVPYHHTRSWRVPKSDSQLNAEARRDIA